VNIHTKGKLRIKNSSFLVGSSRNFIVCIMSVATPSAIWPATHMANRVAARMKVANGAVKHLQFPDASHVLMGFGEAPIRIVGHGSTMELGGSEDGTRSASDSAWSAVLSFLAEV
jgi:hypothetical protein